MSIERRQLRVEAEDAVVILCEEDLEALKYSRDLLRDQVALLRHEIDQQTPAVFARMKEDCRVFRMLLENAAKALKHCHGFEDLEDEIEDNLTARTEP